MLQTRSPPGYTRFVCHAGREIGNRLPPVVGVLVGERVEYVNRLDAIAATWEKAGLSFDGSFPAPPTAVDPGEPSDAVFLPRRVAREMAGLLKDNRARNRQEQTVTSMFVAASRSEAKAPELFSVPVRRWIEATQWFQHAHDGGTTDATFEKATMAKHFATLEELIELMATPIPEQLGGLDEILGQANT